jgi:hypothetical protein
MNYQNAVLFLVLIAVILGAAIVVIDFCKRRGGL